MKKKKSGARFIIGAGVDLSYEREEAIQVPFRGLRCAAPARVLPGGGWKTIRLTNRWTGPRVIFDMANYGRSLHRVACMFRPMLEAGDAEVNMKHMLMERFVRKLNGHSEERDPAVRIKEAPSPDTCGECDGLNTRDCLSMDKVKLSDYRPGDRGRVMQICGSADFRLRLMEMGFVKGAEIKVVKYAPLTDPVELEIKGYHVSLRRDEAAGILMNPPENGDRAGARHHHRRRRGRS